MKWSLYLLLILLAFGCTTTAKEIQQHREKYKADFLVDPRSPLKNEDLQYLDFFDANKKGIVNAKFRLTPSEEPFEMPTYSGITRSYRKWGIATFKWGKDSVSLSLYENLMLRTNPMYKDYLFLPFKDETNGVSTYGGGRYLNMSKADTEDGTLIIDFNKCYNPWCAYSDGFNCPIPPKENQLPFSIGAGEKSFKGEVKAISEN